MTGEDRNNRHNYLELSIISVCFLILEEGELEEIL